MTSGALIPRGKEDTTGRVRFPRADLNPRRRKRPALKSSINVSRRRRGSASAPCRPPFPPPLPPAPVAVPAAPSPTVASIARRRAGTRTAKGLPIIIRGTLRTVLLFIGSAVYYSSFIILWCPLQRAVTTRRWAEYAGPALFRIALQRNVGVTNGTEGESARARAPRPLARAPAPACTRVCACRYTSCTLVKIQSEHESAPWGRLLCTRTLFYRRYITR